MNNLYIQGDLFSQEGILVIPTNQGRVHGAGLAKIASKRKIIEDPDRVHMLDVKTHWRNRVDMPILKDGLRHLILKARRISDVQFSLPLVGLGHGAGDPDLIIPLLAKTVRACPDNVVIVIPTVKILERTPMGTSQIDNTASHIHKYMDMLDKEGNVG